MKYVLKLKNYFPTVNVMIVDSDISQQIKFFTISCWCGRSYSYAQALVSCFSTYLRNLFVQHNIKINMIDVTPSCLTSNLYAHITSAEHKRYSFFDEMNQGQLKKAYHSLSFKVRIQMFLELFRKHAIPQKARPFYPLNWRRRSKQTVKVRIYLLVTR